MLPENVTKEIDRLKKKNYKAIALMGSFARGDELEYSDVDIDCFTGKQKSKEPIIRIIDQRYVVINFINDAEVKEAFTNPAVIIGLIPGLRTCKILWDQNKYLAKLQQKAKQFKWTQTIQQKANKHVSKEFVGWVEEAMKAVQGVKYNDIGRMLSGLFGLSHGMLNILKIQKGVLMTSENTTFLQIVDKIKGNTKLTELLYEVFAVKKKKTLKEQTVSGLRFFLAVADYLDKIIQKEDREVIEYAKTVIKKELD